MGSVPQRETDSLALFAFQAIETKNQTIVIYFRAQYDENRQHDHSLSRRFVLNKTPQQGTQQCTLLLSK